MMGDPWGLNETPAFTPKLSWLPPKGHACQTVFSSQVEKELFEDTFSDFKHSNMSREECQAVKSSVDERIIVIKKKQISGPM